MCTDGVAWFGVWLEAGVLHEDPGVGPEAGVLHEDGDSIVPEAGVLHEDRSVSCDGIVCGAGTVGSAGVLS